MPSSLISQAARNSSGPISPCSNGASWMPSTRRIRARLFFRKCSASDRRVLVIADEDSKGVELDLLVMLAAVQTVEIRDAIDARQYGFAIDDERGRAMARNRK